MRTGTVASLDNRNWEFGDHVAIIRRLSQSRAVALDMELAAIAANGFRFRVPYGTLLCVSDKPLHGEIKLAGMAGEFYRLRGLEEYSEARRLCAGAWLRARRTMCSMWSCRSGYPFRRLDICQGGNPLTYKESMSQGPVIAVRSAEESPS